MNKRFICIILTAIILFGTIQVPVTVSAEPTESTAKASWSRNFGGSGADSFNAVTKVDGGYAAVGQSAAASYGNGDWTGHTSAGGNDAIVVMYDDNGNMKWKSDLGFSGNDRYNAVTPVSDGFIAAGNMLSTAMITKYSLDGTRGGGTTVSCGTTGGANSVIAVEDGYVMVGTADASVFGKTDWIGIAGKGNLDAIIVKYDLNRTIQWKKNFGGSDMDIYNSVTATSDGYIAAGYSGEGSFGNKDWAGVSPKGYYDAIIVKYDTAGNVMWRRNFGGLSLDNDRFITTLNDEVYIVGYCGVTTFGNGDWTGVIGKGNTDGVIIKLNNNGDLQWQRNFGGEGSDDFYSVTAMNDCVVVVGSSTADSFGTGDLKDCTSYGGGDAIIVKFAPDGSVLECGNYGGAGNDNFLGVTVSDGTLVTVGTAAEASFGNGNFSDLSSRGGVDGIIAAFPSENIPKGYPHLEAFDYDSEYYSKDLALRCAEYSALAYKGMEIDLNKNFIEHDDKNYMGLSGLRSRLIEDNFRNIINENYDYEKNQNNPNRVAFTIANKLVKRNNQTRVLVAIIIRGTDGAEWEGNMDITGLHYNQDQEIHNSFLLALLDVEEKLESYINNLKKSNEAQGFTFIATGHSRGGAVANLLAERLSARYNVEQVLAYTFAAPNNTTEANKIYPNIHNFGIDEDFVSLVPLYGGADDGGWGYDKNGPVHSTSITPRYGDVENNAFRDDIIKQADISGGKYRRDFNLQGTKKTINSVKEYWRTVDAYYNRTSYPDPQAIEMTKENGDHYYVRGVLQKTDITLHSFMKDYVAAAAMEENMELLDNYFNVYFGDITKFLIKGSGFGWYPYATLSNYVKDSHNMITYYTAIKHDLFPIYTTYKEQSTVNNTTLTTPTNPNVDEIQKLKAFAEQDGNLERLGWDLNDLSTWQGVIWNNAGENRVTDILLPMKDLFGELDLSGFSALKKIDISCNLIISLDLSGCNLLEELDCSSNYLTELTVPNAQSVFCSSNNLTTLNVSEASELKKLYCNYNELTQLDISTNTKLTELDCSSNTLAALRLSAITDLTTLRCEDNNLSIQEGSDILSKIRIIESKPTALVCYQPQRMPENPVFNADDISKLTSFANHDNNLSKLGWDLSKPESWNGVTWALHNNQYFAEEINIHETELTGNLDLSGLQRLTYLSCYRNTLTSINVSDCTKLKYLSCGSSGISALNINNCMSLTTIECENNFLDIGIGTDFKNNIDTILANEYTRVNYIRQNISADKSMFELSEYETLCSFAAIDDNLSVLGWDMEKPGEWQGVTWKLIDGVYKVSDLDINNKDVSGKLDLSCFDSLTKLDCAMTRLNSVVLPPSLGKLDANTFYDCSELESVVIPDGITEIGEDAFFNCTKLWDVQMGNAVGIIDKHAFRSCESLMSIVLPSSITSIGYNAFYGCENLASVIFTGNAPISFDNNAFENSNKAGIYYYPTGTGFTTPLWKGYPCEPITVDVSYFVSRNTLEENLNILAGDISISVMNTGQVEKPAKAVLAIYSDDILSMVLSKDITIIHGQNTVPFDKISCSIVPQKQHKAKIYLWDEFNTITPIGISIEWII